MSEEKSTVDAIAKPLARWLITTGFVLSAILSYAKNKSIFWVLIHAPLNWIYVIYHEVTK